MTSRRTLLLTTFESVLRHGLTPGPAIKPYAGFAAYSYGAGDIPLLVEWLEVSLTQRKVRLKSGALRDTCAALGLQYSSAALCAWASSPEPSFAPAQEREDGVADSSIILPTPPIRREPRPTAAKPIRNRLPGRAFRPTPQPEASQ